MPASRNGALQRPVACLCIDMALNTFFLNRHNVKKSRKICSILKNQEPTRPHNKLCRFALALKIDTIGRVFRNLYDGMSPSAKLCRNVGSAQSMSEAP